MVTVELKGLSFVREPLVLSGWTRISRYKIITIVTISNLQSLLQYICFSSNASWLKSPPWRWSLRESSFAETFYWKVLIWRLSVTEKLVAEGKHDAIYSCVYNSLTFGNSSQLQHLVSMSSYNSISLATELLRRIPGHVWKCSCNEPLVPFYLCALKVWRAYTEGSVRLNMFQPSGNWKVIIIQR